MKMLNNIAESPYRANAIAGYQPLAELINDDRVKKVLLVGGDAMMMYVALFVALMIRTWSWQPSNLWLGSLLPFTGIFVAWMVVFYIGDLYEIAVNKNEIKFYNRLLRALWFNCGLTAAFFYVSSAAIFDRRPQLLVVIFSAVVTVLLVAWRYEYNAFVQQPLMQRNVLVVGLNDGAVELIQDIASNPQLGYRISAVIANGESSSGIGPGIRVYDDAISLKNLLIDENIGTVVTAFDPRSNAQLIQQLFESLALKVQFFELPTFYEKLTGKIPISNIGHIWFLENLFQSDKGFYEFAKRAMDVLFAAVLLGLALPFLPLIVLLIKFDSKGPALFLQVRTGLLGKTFRVMKFRTMRIEAEKDGVARWAQKNDPRITRVGRFLRKSRIDEIPQLWNVLRGEMSMIGPRPERPEFISKLEQDIPFYNERHLVKPGLTGWAQVRFKYGSSVADSFKKLEYDFFYVKNCSIALDIAILLKTVSIVLTGQGQ